MAVLGILIFLIVMLLLTISGTQIIPHQQAWVVQRLGRFHRILESGPNWIIPLIDRVAYRHALKEETIDVFEQTAITQDNVSVVLDGIVYLKIVDPFAASYGVKDPINAVTQLVQTTMRSEIGKIPLDKTFEERETLNARLVEAINEAAASWGVRCLRYEIKDIKMPDEIRKAMELQMTAERQKRARILESEGQRQAQINLAEGMRTTAVLESEAAQVSRVNRAQGDAEAIELLAKATACGLDKIAGALSQTGGENAAALQIAEKYLEAFRHLAKEGNAVLMSSNIQYPGTMIAEAMGIYEQVRKKRGMAIIEKEGQPV
ncbi:MAG: Stomatin 2 [Parachlamydiales bacterium]|nr:Stomatin 2 [Parachlamydiales bacterium]